MDFEKKAPDWENIGVEPPKELKREGFKAGYKPPASYFNWFFNRIGESVNELQDKLVDNLKALAFKDKAGDADITDVAASKVTQDSTHRMLTDTERTNWNDANSKKHTHSNKSMIDKVTQALLDNWNAAYTHISNKSNPHAVTKSQVGLGSVPNVGTNDQVPTFTQASTLTNFTSGEKLTVILGKIAKAIAEFIAHKADAVIHITSAERTKWNTVTDKVDKVPGKQLSTNDYTTAEKAKLGGIVEGANNYTHPSTHPASMITQDSTHRFATDNEKSTWNGKAAGNHTHSAIVCVDISGITVDVNTYNLSGGSPSIQWYVEKTNGGATNITNIPVTGQPFMLKVESIRWASAADYITKQTFISASAKANYERYCTNGNWTGWSPEGRFTVPPVSGRVLVSDGTSGGIKASAYTIASSVPSGAKFTDTTYDVATQSTNGLMSSADKTKLDGVATGANKYEHPTSDGNKHVPATGTSSNGKVLQAGATAGALSWVSPTRSLVGLGNVDNTSDANKPISTAQQDALNAKVTSSGGDIANTKVGSFTESTASYPVPAANDTVKVGFGKIKKFFEDTKNWMTGVCLIGQIVNNCVTNNAKLPLSAAQGKVLMDLYTVLNTKIGSKVAVVSFIKSSIPIAAGADFYAYIPIDIDTTDVIWAFPILTDAPGDNCTKVNVSTCVWQSESKQIYVNGCNLASGAANISLAGVLIAIR